jgi:hypothetical protein
VETPNGHGEEIATIVIKVVKIARVVVIIVNLLKKIIYYGELQELL